MIALGAPLEILIRYVSCQALNEHDEMVGVVVSKLEIHRNGPLRGYIAMLATKTEYRGAGIATELVKMAINAMTVKDADEVGLLPCKCYNDLCD